jgi:PAS domain S-box-containing protein
VILAGVLPATLLIGTAGSLLSHLAFGTPLRATWIIWAPGDFLGMSIGAPAALIIARFRRFDRPRRLSTAASLRLLALITGLAILPFFISGRSLAFVDFPLFLTAAFWLTPPYAAMGMLLAALGDAALTRAGHGPLADTGMIGMFRLQLFLTCIIFTLFLAQASLADRARSQARALRALARAKAARGGAEAALAELAHSEVRFRTLAENATDVITRYEPDGTVSYISPSSMEVYGYAPEELVGRTGWHLIHPDDLADVRVKQREINEDGPAAAHGATYEFRAVTPTGQVRWIEAAPRVVRDPGTGEIVELHSISRDITRRKAMEAELEARREEAEAASVAKSQFLANMSHEIRTPLNGVIAMADLLARSELGEHDRKLVEIIRSSGDSLNRLLSDILDLARIEAGKVELETAPFHLGEAVRAVAALCALHAQGKGVALEVDVAPAADGCFEGDEVRVRQIVTNLVSNAVKFTAEGEVRVRVWTPEAGGVAVEVTDTGVGFDPALKDRLFDRFQQADGSITRRFGGTGLGLPISRHLAEAMGGTLQCDSTPGQGSRFWFEAPLQPAAPAELAAAAQVEAPEGGGRVLVVDDHPVNRTVAELILADFGFVVDAAENGAEAVEAFTRGGHDLVLMDMQMPVMDGLTAVRHIRAFEAEHGLARTPVLMLSANALPEHALQSEAAGADGHVSKPVTAGALMAAIAAVAEAEADAAKAAARA